jgi:hypothetical protein
MTEDNLTIQQFKMPDGQVHQFRMPNGLSVPEMTRLATESYNQAKEQEFAQAQESNVLETKPRSTLGVLGQSAIKGGIGLVDVLGQMTPYEMLKRGISSGAEALQGNYGQAIQKTLPQQPITKSLIHSGILKPEYEPNTPLLKAADFTTQMATSGGINPATIAKNTLPQLGRFALQSGIGTGTQQLLESAGVNPLGQAVGTALTMGAIGIPFAMQSTVGNVAQNALKNVTPEQIKLADMLMKDAQRLGTPLTAAEALSQVTGGNRLSSTQRIVENAPKSAQTMTDFMNQRPQANINAFNQVANKISPFITRPATLNQAATNFLERSEKGLTGGVEPYYQSGIGEMKNLSAGKTLPVLPTEVKQLAANSAIDDAINHVIKDKYSGVTGSSANDPNTLLSAKKYLDAQYNKFSNKMVESYDKEKAKNAFVASRQLDDFLASKSPSYAKGRDIYANAQTNVIQPRKEGMLGQLADTGGTTESMMGSQRGILMPSAPMATSPQDIKLVIKLLRREDPNVVKDWTRQNLQSIFNENTQNLQSGANQFGAAKFASTLTGNANQKANLKTLISESASPEAYKGFETMLNVFEAQGKRLPAGSATAFNQAAMEELKGGGNFVKLALAPTKPSKLMNMFEDYRMNLNSQKLADLLTDPDGIKKLEALAKTKSNTAKREVLTNSIVGGLISGKEPIEENQ